jgi:NAD(P)-dependent dehydrogenase (short-subunit alcohol dehydrogenase family)
VIRRPSEFGWRLRSRITSNPVCDGRERVRHRSETENKERVVARPIAQQVVVVTGASSGIGRAAALEFARAGARVACAARTVPALDTLVEEIVASGGEAVAVPTDVAEPDAVYALATTVESRFGRIDTWVNNAAVAVWGRVEDITDDEFDRVMRVNFLGHVYGVHACLEPMRRAGGGVIIGVSSLEGVRAVPLHAPYTASKWALRGFYDALRMELMESKDPIAVTTILPGPIATPFFEHARSKVGAMPKPPPPTYAPEVVARAIVHAAVKPTREVPVGGTAISFFMGQRLSPALSDAVMSLRRVAVDSQRADRPDTGTDNVDSPLDEAGRVRGAFTGRVLESSLFTTLVGQRKRPTEALAALRSRAQQRAPQE